MKKIIIILGVLVLILDTVASAAWVPSNFRQWKNTDHPTEYCQRIGGTLCHYQDTSAAWAEINNDWLFSGDTMAYNIQDLLKTSVKLDGKSTIKLTWGGNEYTLTQKPRKLIWFNTDSHNWIDVTGVPVWSTPSVDSNIIHWSNVWPGVDYRIRKLNASIQHGIFYKPAFLDSAVILYNQRVDSLDIALGNVLVYTLSGNMDNADSALGNVDRRRLKNIGKFAFELTKQRVFFPGHDTLNALPVKQRWIKQANKIYCVEYVMMSRLKQIHVAYPTATIWHNASPTVIDGTTNVEDAWIDEGTFSNYNYGAATTMELYSEGGYDEHGLIRCLNVDTELGAGATITACTLAIYNIQYECLNTAVYRVFKPWVEGTQTDGENEPGATWNDWDNDAWEWATAGAQNADDGGSDNSGDGTGADRKATAEDNINLSASAWGYWDISTTLAQAWYDGTANENGVVIRSSELNDQTHLTSSEGESNQPYWKFYYTADGAAADISHVRRIKLLKGN